MRALRANFLRRPQVHTEPEAELKCRVVGGCCSQFNLAQIEAKDRPYCYGIRGVELNPGSFWSKVIIHNIYGPQLRSNNASIPIKLVKGAFGSLERWF